MFCTRAIAAVAFGSWLISACTPPVAVQATGPATSEARIGSTVPIGQEARARVGEVVYGEFNYRLKGGARLVNGYAEQFGLGARVSVPAGAALVPATVGDKPALCTPFAAYSEPASPAATRSVCLFDEDGDSAFERYWITGTLEATSRTIDPPASYRTDEEAIDAGGFKREIVYQGVQGNTLRLMYREYKDNLARPAFQQDLTYTLQRSGATRLSFQNVELEIIEADNNGVRYRVLRGFGG